MSHSLSDGRSHAFSDQQSRAEAADAARELKRDVDRCLTGSTGTSKCDGFKAKRGERGEAADHTDEYELSPIHRHGQSSRRNSAREQTEETATEDINDDGRKRKAEKRPVLVYESIDTVTRHSAEGPSKSNRYPYEHADLRGDRTI